MAKRLETRKELLWSKESVYNFYRTKEFVKDRRRTREQELREDIQHFNRQIEGIIQQNQQYQAQLQTLQSQPTIDQYDAREIAAYQNGIQQNEQVYIQYQTALEEAQARLQRIEQIQAEIAQKAEQAEQSPQAEEQAPQQPKEEEPRVNIYGEPIGPKSDQTPAYGEGFEQYKDPRKKEKSKADAAIKDKLEKFIKGRLEEQIPDALDTDQIMQDMFESDPDFLNMINERVYDQDRVWDEESQEWDQLFALDSADAMQDNAITSFLRNRIEKIKADLQPKRPLYDDSRKTELVQKTKTWKLFDPESVSQEEVELGEADQDYLDYKNKALQEVLDRKEKSKDGQDPKYKNFVQEMGKIYEKAKTPLPSESQWAQNIEVLPYFEWQARTYDSEDFQKWRYQEMQLAEAIKGAPLSDGEIQRLDSHLNAESYYASKDESDELAAEGVEPSGPGIRREGEPPADLNKIPSTQSAEQDVYALLSDQGIDLESLGEEDRAALEELVSKIYAGQLDQKNAELLTYDRGLRQHLRSAAGRMRRFWGPYISGTAADDVISIVDEHLRNIDERELKGWTERLEEVEQRWENQDPRIDPSLVAMGNKEQYISDEYKKWLRQKIYESVSRLVRTSFGQERERDFFKILEDSDDWTAEQMFRDWALGDTEERPGNVHNIVRAYLNPDKAEEAGLDPKQLKQARFIYELLYNPLSDVFIGYDPEIYRDVKRGQRPGAEQIDWTKATERVRQILGSDKMSAKTLQNYHSGFLRFLKEFSKEVEKGKEQLERSRSLRREQEQETADLQRAEDIRNREQEGYAAPTTPSQPKKQKPKAMPDKSSPAAPSQQEKDVAKRRKRLENLLSKVQRIANLKRLSKNGRL